MARRAQRTPGTVARAAKYGIADQMSYEKRERASRAVLKSKVGKAGRTTAGPVIRKAPATDAMNSGVMGARFGRSGSRR